MHHGLSDLPKAVQRMLQQRAALASEPDELGVTPLMFAAAGGVRVDGRASKHGDLENQGQNPVEDRGSIWWFGT